MQKDRVPLTYWCSIGVREALESWIFMIKEGSSLFSLWLPGVKSMLCDDLLSDNVSVITRLFQLLWQGSVIEW